MKNHRPGLGSTEEVLRPAVDRLDRLPGELPLESTGYRPPESAVSDDDPSYPLSYDVGHEAQAGGFDFR